MKKIRIPSGGLGKLFYLISVLLLAVITVSCDKDDPTSSSAVTLTCEAGCYSMDWNLVGESGTYTYSSNCSRTYNAFGDYTEDCTGSISFEESGNSYNFTATFDWINCAIDVTVEGVGSCSDQVDNPNLKTDCDCEKTSGINRIVVYKDISN
ncbi:hypothetical protein ACFLTH_05770 [Bacteroidota bacterium]